MSAYEPILIVPEGRHRPRLLFWGGGAAVLAAAAAGGWVALDRGTGDRTLPGPGEIGPALSTAPAPAAAPPDAGVPVASASANEIGSGSQGSEEVAAVDRTRSEGMSGRDSQARPADYPHGGAGPPSRPESSGRYPSASLGAGRGVAPPGGPTGYEPYTIMPTDCLWAIWTRNRGNPNRRDWQDMYKANRHLPDPAALMPGDIVYVPKPAAAFTGLDAAGVSH